MQFRRGSRSSRVFGALAVALFLVPAIYASATHEMWRDEMQAWLIARDSPTLGALFHNLMHEGHPPLWHLLLYPIAHLTHDPRAMRPLHLAIAAASVWLFATRAPFSRPARLLFAVGYFPVYEYAAICRNYGLGLLFALAFCAAWPKRRVRPLVPGIFVALLAMSSSVAWVLACVAIVPLLVELVRRDTRVRGAWGGAAIAAAGIVASFAVFCPKPDTAFALRAPEPSSLGDAVDFLLNGMVAIPRIHFYWWNENMVGGGGRALPIVGAVVGVLAAVWTISTTVRGKLAAFVYVAGSAALVAFFVVVYRGDVRHHGFLFVVFLMAAWLARPRLARAGRATVTAILALHAVGGALAVTQEGLYVFSSGERVATWLRAHQLEHAPMVGEPDWAVTTVLGYLDGEAAWSPRTGRQGTFVRWTKDRTREPSEAEVIAFTRDVCAREGKDTVLVINHPLWPDKAEAAGLVLGAELYDAVNPTENFAVYVLPATACARSPQASRR